MRLKIAHDALLFGSLMTWQRRPPAVVTTYELISKTELARLRRDADLGKSVGRYQQYHQGWRTWRLDTATGSTCLLLTTDGEWKKPEIAAQGCRTP